MSKEEKRAQSTAKDSAQTPKKPAEWNSLADKLRKGELDLRVEEVEERISPSETNVFDK